MSPADKDGKNMSHLEDSVEVELSPEDLEFLDAVDSEYSRRTFACTSLNDAAERLLDRLKVARGHEEIEVFGLAGPEQDAAGILAQSGEAVLYRNERDHLCIAYKGSGLIEGLLLHG